MTMQKNVWVTAGAIGLFLLFPRMALPASEAYPTMAPVEQYLIPDQAQEIASARSAAPPSISEHAEILVLTRDGYVTAAKGSNDFVCLVQRSWFSPLEDAQFWNPKERSPICFNPPGVRSVLPVYRERTKWVLAGLSRDEIVARTKAEIDAGRFLAPEIGTLSYMQAKDSYLSGAHGHWHPHLMFFLPRMNVADWGANLTDAPVMGAAAGIVPYTIFFVPVSHWSDGTPDTTPIH